MPLRLNCPFPVRTALECPLQKIEFCVPKFIDTKVKNSKSTDPPLGVAPVQN